MFDLEKEINEWKKLLDNGEIDQETFDKEVERLTKRNEKKNEFNEKIRDYHEKVKTRREEEKKNNQNISTVCRLFRIIKKYTIPIIIIVLFISLFVYIKNDVPKEYEYVSSLESIGPPIQRGAKDFTLKKIGDVYVEIDYVATYDISGRVVDVQRYFEFNTGNKLSSRDIGISWGPIAKEENYGKIKWTSLGNRYLSWHTNDSSLLGQIGGRNSFNSLWSNNHLIPKDDKIEKLIKKIKKNDFIRIEGYLINAFWDGIREEKCIWTTSTSRYDTGNGACEVVYVTGIKWLKEIKIQNKL